MQVAPCRAMAHPHMSLKLQRGHNSVPTLELEGDVCILWAHLSLHDLSSDGLNPGWAKLWARLLNPDTYRIGFWEPCLVDLH